MCNAAHLGPEQYRQAAKVNCRSRLPLSLRVETESGLPGARGSRRHANRGKFVTRNWSAAARALLADGWLGYVKGDVAELRR
jgi:hypothetical protein